MKTVSVPIEKLVPHPYHKLVYCTSSVDSLTESIVRTGNKPVYPIIVVPIQGDKEKYWIISGVSRVDSMFLLGFEEVDVIVKEDLTDERVIMNMIIDLNCQRVKTGSEHKMEFRHYLLMYPVQRGVLGSRYEKIGKKLGISSEKVKDYVILDNFFKDEGESILDSVFGGSLSINQCMTIKKVVEKFPDKFTSKDSFNKLCDGSFDFNRLEYSLSNLDQNDESDFDMIKVYLNKDLSPDQFHDLLVKMDKVEQRKDNHRKNKVSIPEIDETYKSEHSHIIHGNNRTVDFVLPFGKFIRCLVGSCPYGNLRLNSDNPDTETGHNMTGHQYGVYLSETYERYKPYMSPDGSIYVIIDDFRNKQGSLSCSIEHFVVEMERKGFYLTSRIFWWKNNPQPRSHKSKNMVNGMEMVYRFTLDPKKYYSNPNLFIELEEHVQGVYVGCTNTDNRGNTTRGGSYYQPNLKKPRNTMEDNSGRQLVLDNIDGTEDDLIRNIEIIRGNVQHPEDYFRKDDEKRHTSTSPQYLTMTLILESTEPGDLVVDIWNGVGGTMESSLCLKRDYIGVEQEENYIRQTQRRLQMIESGLNDQMIGTNHPDLKVAA
jgi:DNA modification methylase